MLRKVVWFPCCVSRTLSAPISTTLRCVKHTGNFPDLGSLFISELLDLEFADGALFI